MKSLALLGVSALFLLSACGGDSDSATSPAKSSSADMEVATYEMLPSCAEKREGKTAYVKDQDQGYICQNKKWVESDDAVEVYPSSTSASVEKNSAKMGTLKDLRDGQTYKTVQIGSQVWMAENLNFKTESSICYKEDENYCIKYGRLYRWAVAMDSACTWSTNGKRCGDGKTCLPSYPVRGVCPEGWHLPSHTEWDTLFTAVGGQLTASKVLKSTSGWYNGGNGTDAYSFSALPAGFGGGYDIVVPMGANSNIWDNAYFWSSTEFDSVRAYYMYLFDDFDNAFLNNTDKINWFSVRCLKDYNDFEESKYSSGKEKIIVSSSSNSDIKNSAKMGTLKDSRDGQTYKTVQIGNQVWMAENLNFKTDSSFCYNDSAEYCSKYGRLYKWAAAVGKSENECGYDLCSLPSVNIRGVCPEGWHLPSHTEWDTLFTAVGGSGRSYAWYGSTVVGEWLTAGKVLKSTSGWFHGGNGTDAFSFSALPAGLRFHRNYDIEGDGAYFWSSTELAQFSAYYVYMYYDYDSSSGDYYNYDDYDNRCSKDDGLSVRCLKD